MSTSILKTYARRVDLEQEGLADRLIEEHTRTIRTSLESKTITSDMYYTLVTTMFMTHSTPIGIRHYPPNELTVMLNKHPALVELLQDCINAKSFIKLRNLEIFRPLEGPGAVARLRQNHADLFQRLSVVLAALNKWQRVDISKNGGVLHTVDPDTEIEYAISSASGTHLPRGIKRIREVLRTKRLCPREHLKRKTKSQELAKLKKEHPAEFKLIYDQKNGDNVVSSEKEYRYISNALFCFVGDSVRCAPSTSSFYKASAFNVYLIHSSLYLPTFGSNTVVFRENVSWHFPLILGTPANDVYVKYTPRSNWSLDISDPVFPLAISEIVSQKDESNENRMLIQAIAASRVGNYFLKPSTESLFFIVAICLYGDMKVRRYIVQPETRHPGSEVHILGETFDLSNRTHVSLFLLEMLNLTAAVESLVEDFDYTKRDELLMLPKEAKSITSLTQAIRSKGKLVHPSSRQSISKDIPVVPEGREDVSTNFDSLVISGDLEQFGFRVGGIHAFHSNIALVFDKTDDLVGCLKFLPHGCKELEILSYLKTFESPLNHCIRPNRFWPSQQGTVMSLPLAGNRITKLQNLSDHLWGICRQLIEGVQFLHDHGVAHLDLKPSNLLVPVTYGVLTIIDFGLSVHLTDQMETVRGRVGTEGYIAPEVGCAPYDPLKADLFSCGVIIRELCGLVHPSAERSILWTIASDLMNPEPRQRPMMSQVLAQLDNLRPPLSRALPERKVEDSVSFS